MKNELINLIIDCCKSSAIMYENKYPAIKFFDDIGEILFVEKSRMLDFISIKIPNWEKGINIFKMLDEVQELKFCESHKMDNRYCYSIMLIK